MQQIQHPARGQENVGPHGVSGLERIIRRQDVGGPDRIKTGLDRQYAEILTEASGKRNRLVHAVTPIIFKWARGPGRHPANIFHLRKVASNLEHGYVRRPREFSKSYHWRDRCRRSSFPPQGAQPGDASSRRGLAFHKLI